MLFFDLCFPDRGMLKLLYRDFIFQQFMGQFEIERYEVAEMQLNDKK